MRARLTALGLVAALALSGCTEEQPAPPEPTGSSTPSEEPTTDEPTPSSEPSSDPPAALDWQPVAGSVDDVVTVSGRWTLTVAADGGSATLDGPRSRTVEAPAGFSISEALIDGQYAAVVAEHDQAGRPNDVTVVDLRRGREVDADVEPGVGGSFALGSGLLASTATRGRDYCLGVVDLVAGRSSQGPCVPPRHGISNLDVGPAGISAMTFDDGRPSCRTLNRLEGGEFSPLAGVAECRGWEAVVSETFAIWGEVANERRIEAGSYFVDSGGGPVELGPGTTGSLTWCGDAAYVVRDPQRSKDPARLLRVDVEGGTTEVVYETEATGRAFLSEPRCGGSDLTITAYTNEGDEQVTARLP
ncbi:hypothetical protein GCM10009623_14940 [Nocardioides aestuarii]|uniref:Uncharacterized protein n=1 Tax=Nocardioides aestuarii TaxID=252231 RepID=A0ABW4TJS4_9ACTN